MECCRDVASCPRQRQFFEFFAKEPKLVTEKSSELGIRGRKEDLSRPGDRQVAQMVQERQDVDVINVCNRIVEKQYWRAGAKAAWKVVSPE